MYKKVCTKDLRQKCVNIFNCQISSNFFVGTECLSVKNTRQVERYF